MGRNRDKVARIALSENRGNTPAWRFPETSDMDGHNGFRRVAIIPEFERAAGQQLFPHALVKKKPTYPTPDPADGTDNIAHTSTTGRRLVQEEHDLSATNDPRNSDGAAL